MVEAPSSKMMERRPPRLLELTNCSQTTVVARKIKGQESSAFPTAYCVKNVRYGSIGSCNLRKVRSRNLELWLEVRE